MGYDGTADTLRTSESLAKRLPAPLAPLARLALNYMWSWTADGPEVFRALDAEHWELTSENPVRMLQEVPPEALDSCAGDAALVRRINALHETVTAHLAKPSEGRLITPERPVAFLCAEFGLHRSLPIYSGGLGVLAGDILKESSDLAIPVVGVGLLYKQGYFQQRIDSSGQQHEYWVPLDPLRVPMSLVTTETGEPLTVSLPVRGKHVVVQVWRVEVGRVPLFLLDADRDENHQLDRWITGRLYVGDRAIRLAQYALLGVGSVRALTAMGFDPAVIHLNEGHAALAPLELARMAVKRGVGMDDAIEAARRRTIFTTHTPVAAGNEGYGSDEVSAVLGDFPRQLGIAGDHFLEMGRVHPENRDELFSMTPLGIRVSRAANGVSRRHGEVAREMWQPLFPNTKVESVPIGHVTNGVHIPTWMAAPMRDLLSKYLGQGWQQRAGDPATWQAIDDIPDRELWAVRCELRAGFLKQARRRMAGERLGRYESKEYVEAALEGMQPDVLTIGFARRVATYKRLHLLTLEPARAIRLLGGSNPVQLILAGKAHPQDDEGKAVVRGFFGFKREAHLADRIAYLDNYDMSVASQLVAGCDVWVNVPRPPLEASGTSGMKSAINGGLNCSILDGWWCEGFNGGNGWGLPGDAAPDPAWQDTRDADAFFSAMESEVVPLFYDRDADGVPHGWIARVKSSLRSNGPQFSATRMMGDYVHKAYEAGVQVAAPGTSKR